MKSYPIAVIAGDGTGPEVVREAIKVLRVAEKNFEFLVRCCIGPNIWARALITTEAKNCQMTSAYINAALFERSLMNGCCGLTRVKKKLTGVMATNANEVHLRS